MKRVKKHATIISTGIRFPKGKSGVMKNNQKLIILTVLFICGLFLGAIAVKNTNDTLAERLRMLIENFCLVRSQQSIFVNFLSMFGTECIFLVPAMIFGICVVGEPILWLLPLVKGMGIGIISAYLYSNHSLNGMLYFAVILLAPAVFSVAALLLGCKESILMTRDINRILFINGEHGGNTEFLKLYILRYIVLFASVLLSSGLGSFLTFAFAGKISLF